MPAGTKYNKKLNMDINSVKTPAFHDANLDEWLMAAANVVKTEGGLFVFQKGTDDGKAKVAAELTGSILGKDIVTGDPKELSAVEDDGGKFVLRVVDAAPHDLWTPRLIYNEAVGGNKLITVPANKEYKLQHIYLHITASATVGNRTPGVVIEEVDGASYYRIFDCFFATIATSSVRRGLLGSHYPKDTAYDSNSRQYLPLPDLTLKAGDRIQIADALAIDHAGDTFRYYIRVLERNV